MRSLQNNDKEESVYSDELALLRRIAETSCNLVKARHWAEFRDACGGMQRLELEHEEAVMQYERWLSDGVG